MLQHSYTLVRNKARTSAIKVCLTGRVEADSALILTSSPRSGSTLLGQALGSIPNSCVLFEPLQLTDVPEAKAAGFSWRTYVDPEEQWPEGEAFLKRVFTGKVINDWTSKEMSIVDAYRCTRMIVKFVRANRLLPWICRTFEVPAPILLIRHPCAVIASQLNYGWKSYARRPDAPKYLDEYPAFQAALSETKGVEEYLAALWALDQLPPLSQQTPHPWTIVTYEELVLQPEITLSKIFEKWDLEVDMDDALSKIKEPSAVVSRSGISGINGWKEKLTVRQISQVLDTVSSFGLSFYTKSDEADYGTLHSEHLAENVRSAGIG